MCGTLFVPPVTGVYNEMRRLVPYRNTIFFLSSLLSVALLAGCAPQKAVREVAELCYPYDASVEVNNRQMTVAWRTNCHRLMSGYFIYISKEPLVEKYPGTEMPASVIPFNHIPFPGDTNPEDEIEHFVAEGLNNGVKYYVSVRVVNPDRTLSKPSNEVAVVCGPRGEMHLSIRYKSDKDGFSFEKNTPVRADDLDNDLYFHSRDGNDYLVSPNRLDGFLKANKFLVLPFKGDFDQVKMKLPTLGKNPDSDRVVVREGNWVYILTSENKYALVKVLSVSGEGERRSLKLFYAYSPLSNEAIF